MPGRPSLREIAAELREGFEPRAEESKRRAEDFKRWERDRKDEFERRMEEGKYQYPRKRS